MLTTNWDKLAERARVRTKPKPRMSVGYPGLFWRAPLLAQRAGDGGAAPMSAESLRPQPRGTGGNRRPDPAEQAFPVPRSPRSR